jgi:hypothetical protein
MLEAGLLDIGESWYDREIREKTQARKRKEAEEREKKEHEAKPAVEASASWANRVNRRIDEELADLGAQARVVT